MRTAAIAILISVVLAACGERSQEAAMKGVEVPRADPAEAPPSIESVLAGLPEAGEIELDAQLAADLVSLSLTCVDKEYPNKPSNVLAGESEVTPPAAMHPAFFGCFDWHSAVHGHWAMVRILKRGEELGLGEELMGKIRGKLDSHLDPELIAGEVEYFEKDHHKLFERPYGWGWLMRLQAELVTWEDPDAARWSRALFPLVELLERRTADYLRRLSVPLRAGTHHSTAYAMAHMHDYAVAADRPKLRSVLEERGRSLYLADRDCPSDYEPSGEDFISPCLAETDLMGRLLGPEEFAGWLDSFLPDPASNRFAPLRKPPEVRDREDPRIGHLIGLSLYRGSAYGGIASRLPAEDPRRVLFDRLAAIHLKDGLEKMEGSGYGGEHWLASFAIHALTGVGRKRSGDGQS